MNYLWNATNGIECSVLLKGGLKSAFYLFSFVSDSKMSDIHGMVKRFSRMLFTVIITVITYHLHITVVILVILTVVCFRAHLTQPLLGRHCRVCWNECKLNYDTLSQSVSFIIKYFNRIYVVSNCLSATGTTKRWVVWWIHVRQGKENICRSTWRK